jgi:hypothetical protein
LTAALVGGEWSVSLPGRFTLGERTPSTHWIGGWVGPRVGLDDVEKRKFLNLPGLELRPSRHPARSQSLYRLRYPVSFGIEYQYVNMETDYLGRCSDEAVDSKTEELGVDSWRVQHISLFFTASKPVSGIHTVPYLYRGLVPRCSGWTVRLSDRLLQVLRFGMRGGAPPHTHICLCHFS